MILPVLDNAPKEIVGRSLSFGLLRLLATLTEAFVWEESTPVRFYLRVELVLPAGK